MPPAAACPRSASDFPTNIAALVLGLVAMWAFQRIDQGSLLFNAIAGCGVTALVVAVSDWVRFKVQRRASTGLRWDARSAASAERIAVKLAGLFLTLAVIGAAYWIFPEYRATFYEPYWTLLKACGPWLLLAAPFYFWWLDRLEVEPKDSYWEVGMLLQGRRPARWGTIAQHLGGWVVKAFFTPIMVVSLTRELSATDAWLHAFFGGAPAWFDLLFHLTYLIDLLFCVVGYCLTLRVLDSHIRTTEPTAGGWLVALLCYQPFSTLLETGYLRYDDGYHWNSWLADHPWLQNSWGLVIVGLLAIYALSTVAFGLRFSNLTNRGIITSGPYRFTKHPAYLAKTASWWMISIPFVSQLGWSRALHNCLALALLNTIYFLRARTEERHLGRDPDYAAYASWIDAHGLFRFRGRSGASRR